MTRIPLDNESIVRDYLQRKKRKKAQLTIYSYSKTLGKFFKDCPKRIADLTQDDVFEWLENYYGGAKPATIRNRISILSAFFTYCTEEKLIDYPLINPWWNPRLPKTLPKALDKDDMSRVMVQAEEMSLRDRTIIEFLRSSGARRAEASGLRVKHFNLDELSAKVLGKGNKWGELHFSCECCELLRQLIPKDAKPEGGVFLNRFGKPLSARAIYNITAKAGMDAKIPGKLGPHKLRHTFATILLSNGADYNFIADELRHANLRNVHRYASLMDDAKILMYRRFMG
ncbi:MAG TPA: tyrosine-type recombinase/integrase [Syntrophomonadaceae bacterium]|nr:tyrosine-type recombinase/integrase [Syntrophomonadaceae bacterium]